jgi:hypothetical protein
LLRQTLEEYLKHTTLNIGQAAHELRYLYSHPDMDGIAARGTFDHLRRSLWLRTRRFANDVFFAIIPPHWHHTPAELRQMQAVPLKKWFFYGYCQWRFDEQGQPKLHLDGTEDRRWDSRCIEKPARHTG